MVTELQDITKYWNQKYPHIYIRLWENQDSTKFYGKMMTSENTRDISADTIGALIGEGENFLRQLKV